MNYMLSEQDRKDWELYIQKVFKSPEAVLPRIEKEIDLAKRLDLHGMTVHQAYHRFKNFVSEHAEIGTSDVVVITGKSGQISREFTSWCRKIAFIKKWEPVVDSRGGIGSYRIKLSA